MLLISSYGGCGTTALRKSFNALPHDEYKHVRHPPNIENPDVKAVYVYADPINAVLSLYRQRRAGAGWGQPHTFLKFHGINIGVTIPPLLTLSQLIDGKKDLFKLEDHFDNWFNAKMNYPIMLIKYEVLGTRIGDIEKFLGMKSNFTWKPRISSIDDLNDKIRNGMLNIYNAFRIKLKSIDDVYITKTKP